MPQTLKVSVSTEFFIVYRVSHKKSCIFTKKSIIISSDSLNGNVENDSSLWSYSQAHSKQLFRSWAFMRKKNKGIKGKWREMGWESRETMKETKQNSQYKSEVCYTGHLFCLQWSPICLCRRPLNQFWPDELAPSSQGLCLPDTHSLFLPLSDSIMCWFLLSKESLKPVALGTDLCCETHHIGATKLLHPLFSLYLDCIFHKTMNSLSLFLLL